VVVVAAPQPFGLGVGVLSLAFEGLNQLTGSSYVNVNLTAAAAFDNATSTYLKEREVWRAQMPLTKL
jgi:hypothetical protein